MASDTPGLVERLRGLASIALKAPMIAALSDAADDIERSENHRNDLMDKIVEQRTEIAALKRQIATLRDEVIEECRAAYEAHDKTGREWVAGSLWDKLNREGAARVAALKSSKEA